MMIDNKTTKSKISIILVLALLFSIILEMTGLSVVSAATTKRVNYQDGDSHCPYCTTTDGYGGLCANASQTVGIATSNYEITPASKAVKAAVWLGMGKELKAAGKLSKKERYIIHYAVSGILGHADLPSSPATYEEVKSLEKKAKAFTGTIPTELSVFIGKRSGNQDIVIWKIIPNGNLKIVKKSTTTKTSGLSSYTLQGITFKVYDENKSKLIGTLTTGKDGKTTALSLPPGTYYFKETDTGTSGYALDSTWQKVTISSSNTQTVTVKNEPKLGKGQLVKKIVGDEEKATLDGFKFTFANVENSAIKYSGITNEDGELSISMLAGEYKISENIGYNQKDLAGYVDITGSKKIKILPGKTSNKVEWKNEYNTNFPVRLNKKVSDEGTVAGFKFQLQIEGTSYQEVFTTDGEGWIKQNDSRDIETIGGVEIKEGDTVIATEVGYDSQRYLPPVSQTITISKENPNTFYFVNQAKETQVKLKKTSTDGKVEGIMFKLKGTSSWGQEYSLSKETDENGNIDFGFVAPGTFFIEEVDYDKMQYQNPYKVDGYENPIQFFSITGDEGEKTICFNNIKRNPKMVTNAYDTNTNDRISYANDSVVIIDEINYEDLVAGEEYVLKGSLVNQVNGEPLESHGEPIEETLAFVPEKDNGTVKMKFEFDGSHMAGISAVIMQRLYQDDKLITEAVDLSDQNETISFPSISTVLTGEDGEKEISNLDKNTLIDRVTLKGLIPGKTYLIQGAIIDKVNDNQVIAEGKCQFVAEKTEEDRDVTFRLKLSDYAGKALTALETLQYDDTKVCEEINLESKAQTVYLVPPEIPTDTHLDKPKPEQETPKTGDYNKDLFVYITLIIVSASTILLLIRKRGNKLNL